MGSISMSETKEDLDDVLEGAIREHLHRYTLEYLGLKKEGKVGSLDLLEYRIDPKNPRSKHIIDRDLLADYLTLKVAKSNNRLQWIVGIFTIVIAITTVLQIANLLNWIH
jgi:hypothetical protein